jgi:hypothetical protein
MHYTLPSRIFTRLQTSKQIEGEMMRRTAWIWAVGSAAWTFDAIVNLYYRNRPHAELAFMVAIMFAIAWAYYSRQPTR